MIDKNFSRRLLINLWIASFIIFLVEEFYVNWILYSGTSIYFGLAVLFGFLIYSLVFGLDRFLKIMFVFFSIGSLFFCYWYDYFFVGFGFIFLVIISKYRFTIIRYDWIDFLRYFSIVSVFTLMFFDIALLYIVFLCLMYYFWFRKFKLWMVLLSIIVHLLNWYFAFVLGYITGFLMFTLVIGYVVCRFKISWFRRFRLISFWKRNIPYLFLISLLVFVVNEFYPLSFVDSWKYWLMGISVVLGSLALWLNREVIDEVEEESGLEAQAEIKRGEEFDTKFKFFTKFNVSYGISDVYFERKWFLLIFRVLICPFVFLFRLPYVFVKWMYKEGWWYSAGLIGLISLFILKKIYLLKSYLIGTDEANSLYVIKLLNENLILYKDFWYREPFSIYLLYPFTKLFGLNFITLRTFVILIYIFILIFIFKLFKKNLNKLFTLYFITIIIILETFFFRIYWGLFNQIWFLQLIIIIYIILYKNFKENMFYLCLLGIQVGISILTYKASKIFLIIIPIILLIENSKYYKLSLTYLFFTSIPILLFYILNIIYSKNIHFYTLILKDIIYTYIFITTIITIYFFFNKYIISITNFFNIKLTIKNLNILLFFTYLLISICYLIYFKSSSFWGMYIESLAIFLIIYYINFININNKLLKYIGVVFLLIHIVLTIIYGWGSSGFINNVDSYFSYIITFILVIFSYSLLLIKNNVKNIKIQHSYILTIVNFFLLALLTGAKFMPSRYKYLLFIYPILSVYFLNIINNIKNIKKILLIFILISTIILNYSIFALYSNSYTLYSINSVEDIKHEINLSKNNISLFTGDLAIPIILNLENSLKTGSAWIYRTTNETYIPFQNYCSTNKINHTFICYSHLDYTNYINNTNVDYVISSSRGTHNLFLINKNNSLNTIINKNYTELKIKKFTIYIRNE